MKQISCDAHDYFEIVCLRHSFIQVTTFVGQSYSGVAFDIKTTAGCEMLHIKATHGWDYVALSDIQKLAAIGNRHPSHNFTKTWPIKNNKP